jgi:hypothetical protein
MTDRAEKPTGRAARRRALAEQDERDEAMWELELSLLELRPGDPTAARLAREREGELIRLQMQSARFWHEEHKRLTRGGLVQQMWRSLFA